MPRSATSRARERLAAEAVKSRAALAEFLEQLEKPLKASGLWRVTRTAAKLCAGTFEKAYLSKLSAVICGVPEMPAEFAGLAAELFMFSALTVDDWADGTRERAGKPATHASQGPEQAILAANCLAEAGHFLLTAAADAVPGSLRGQFFGLFRMAVLSIQAGQARILPAWQEPQYVPWLWCNSSHASAVGC